MARVENSNQHVDYSRASLGGFIEKHSVSGKIPLGLRATISILYFKDSLKYSHSLITS